MTSMLCLRTSEDLGQLTGALRSGRLIPPFTPIPLRRYVPGLIPDSRRLCRNDFSGGP